jgi:hypothetical protein
MPILLAGTIEFVHIEQVSALFKFRLGQVSLYVYNVMYVCMYVCNVCILILLLIEHQESRFRYMQHWMPSSFHIFE